MLSSCGISMSSEEFFRTLSVKGIPDVSIDTVRYYTYFIEDDIPSLGKVSTPLLGYSIKYDTLARFKAVVIGAIFFEKSYHEANQYEKIDSIRIDRLIVWNNGSLRECFSSVKVRTAKIVQDQCKPLEECPLPKRVLKRIRNDFCIRMKHTRYIINRSMNNNIIENGISVQHLYHLY